jgi:hypothetical protein
VKNNLEDIFKVLQDYSEEAPDLMAEIHAKRSKPFYRFFNHLRGNIFKYAAGLILLISAFIFYPSFNSGNDLNTENSSSQGQLEKSGDRALLNSDKITAQNNNSDIKDGSDKHTETTQIIPITVKPNSSIDQSDSKQIGTDQTPPNEQKADPIRTDQDQPIVRVEQIEGTKVGSDAKIENSDETVEENLEESKPVVTIEEPKIETPIEETPENTPEKIIEDKDIQAIAEDDAQNNEKEQQNTSPVDEPSKPVVKSDQNDPIKDIPEQNLPLSKWSIELAAGNGIAGNGIISNNEASAIRNSSETQRASIQASLLINYELNKNVELQSGVNYTTSRSEVDFVNKYKKTLMDITSQDVIIFDFPGGPGRKVTIHDTTYSSEDVSDKYLSSNLIQSYQIPISVKYNWHFKRFSLFLKTGVNIEVASVSEGRVLDANLNWNELNSDAYIRKNNLGSYQVGFGANYLISNRVAFLLEGNTQRTIHPVWSDSNPVQEIQINNNAKLGLKFYF